MRGVRSSTPFARRTNRRFLWIIDPSRAASRYATPSREHGEASAEARRITLLYIFIYIYIYISIIERTVAYRYVRSVRECTSAVDTAKGHKISLIPF
jgi:hypothetical protein